MMKALAFWVFLVVFGTSQITAGSVATSTGGSKAAAGGTAAVGVSKAAAGGTAAVGGSKAAAGGTAAVGGATVLQIRRRYAGGVVHGMSYLICVALISMIVLICANLHIWSTHTTG